MGMRDNADSTFTSISQCVVCFTLGKRGHKVDLEGGIYILLLGSHHSLEVSTYSIISWTSFSPIIWKVGTVQLSLQNLK